MNVLVVEDNAINRQLAVYLLKKAGFDVYEADSGKQTFEFLSMRTPDVILLDIQLPEMDGVEILKRIREKEGTKNIKVIALTAYTMRGDREKFESAGFDGYLPKPIEPQIFAKQILDIVNNNSEGNLSGTL
jgi:FOG: CheY-like receiver